MKLRYLPLGLLLLVSTASAHDTWVETNTNLIRCGDAIYIDLKLGNHGNDHRDFKLASKLTLDGATLAVITPDGRPYDLRERLVDVGYAPGEGYWTAKLVATQPGLYLVAHTFDKVMHYAPVRAVKSAKTIFAASPTLDQVQFDQTGFDRVLGHPLELVPTVNPVAPMGPGKEIGVRVLYRGKPLPQARVSFIPRGVALSEEFDPVYERQADENGQASFTPNTGNVYLVVVHHAEPQEAGPNYTSTKYSATLTVFVPELCPCCSQ